jgi:hypothetical protein
MLVRVSILDARASFIVVGGAIIVVRVVIASVAVIGR